VENIIKKIPLGNYMSRLDQEKVSLTNALDVEVKYYEKKKKKKKN
jgi:hypothetical protein